MTTSRHYLLALFVVVCLLALCWPGYALYGNSIEPFVIGMPYSLAWVVGWVLLAFVAIAVYHALGEDEEG